MNYRFLISALLVANLIACDRPNADADAAEGETPNATVKLAAAESPPPAKEAAKRPAAKPVRKERPLPAFSGFTLDRKKISVSELLGKRLMIFFFNPEVKNAEIVATAIARVAVFRGNHNFQIVGVSQGSNTSTTRSFVAKHGFDFPIIDDPSAKIARQLGLQVPIAIIGADSEGYVTFGMGQFPSDGPDDTRVIENMLRASLRLPELASNSEPELGTRPEAPNFEIEILDSDEGFELAAQRGKPVMLIFFLHTCPHCHDAMAAMKQAINEMPEANRPAMIGIEVTGRTAAVRAKLSELSLDFFPTGFDHDGSIRAAFGVFGGVPDTFLIDAQGRIAAHIQGWRDESDSPLLRMRLAQLGGAPVPMLLRSKGYSGNEACGVCHESEHATWMLTEHARAFDTLVKHGKTNDAECVSCHVVGYDELGGFEGQDTPQLENVGCETCHGRGGGHLSPEFVKILDYTSICVTCHDTKHSLGFEYATFLPKISHAANKHVLALPLEEKRKILAERGLRRSNLLPTAAKIVGSDACQSCHQTEYEIWRKSGHARAGESLTKKGSEGDQNCLACHTTGYGLDGGFAKGAELAAHADRGRVGCESCHGPGGDHIGEETPKFGSIVALGDKCDSCVILQICGSCHDDANDPGFEFEVEAKIEQERHGTTEPGTGTPKLANEKFEGS
ncbi:MAG: redoxin domain-containing protein [Deltaproteobacteria bacterium]|nr:redoxin domain-containing protein [Deltaproteobacteria bacterium]